jgi:hypothetical protein
MEVTQAIDGETLNDVWPPSIERADPCDTQPDRSQPGIGAPLPSLGAGDDV